MKTFLFAFFILLCFTCPAQDPLGLPFVTNYSYRDYGADPVNWWAVEDDRGVMYFANGAGILEFDGVNWTVIPGPEGSPARSLAKDDDGTIYCGFNGDIGYLEPDDNGSLRAVSLRDKLPAEHRFFEEVWETDYFKGEIYFRTNSKIFRWDGESMDILSSDNDFHVGSVVHDEYYVRIWNRGLCKLVNDSFVLVPGGEQFADIRIYQMLPYDEERMLVGTRNDGFFIYDGDKFTPFKTEADPYVENELYLPGLALDDGRFILNTFANGLYIINREGKLLQKITTDGGLQDNSVDYVYLDSRGVLWMVLFRGISSMNLNSKFSRLASAQSLPSSIVFDLVRHEGTLYAGSNNGLYYYEEVLGEFVHMEGTFGQTYDLIKHRNRLYGCSGGMGVYEIKSKSFEYVRQSINYDFQISNMFLSRVDTNRILLNRRPGMSTLYFNEETDQFEVESSTDKVHPDIGGFDEDSLGNIWIAGEDQNTVVLLKPRIEDGRMNLEESPITVYDSTHGVPVGGFNFWYRDGEIEFFSENMIYGFDYNREQFVEKEIDYPDVYDPTASFFATPRIDPYGRTWFGAGGGVVMTTTSAEGTREMITAPFLELKDFPVWKINFDKGTTRDDLTTYFVGPEGIVQHIGEPEAPSFPDFRCMIRDFSIGEDSLLYGGAGTTDQTLQLSHRDNTVTIDYSSPFYINQENIEYQTFLQGLDQVPSSWTRQASREYINLPPGNYTFEVKARNIFGTESNPVTYSFRILPPWYLTWWAYVIYALAFIALVYFIVRSRTEVLRKQQKQLEEMVNEQTREVRQRVDELATVNRVSQALTEKLEMGALIKMVGEQMKKLFKSNISYLAILDEKTQTIHFPYQDGDNMQPIKFGEGLTSRVIRSGEPLLINHDISREYDQMGIERIGKNAASYLGVPIPVEGKVIGVISVQSTELENRFDDNDKRLLATIARNVGIAFHNAELYEEAREAKAQAEDANEAKSAFLSTVSHELRTPLTSVLGFAKIIRKRLEDKIFPAVTIEDQKIKRTMKQVSENLNVVVSEGERLTNLINDVLDLAKIESGKMDWQMKPVFVQDIIQRAIASTTSLFEAKGLRLVENVPGNLPLVNADQDKMIQVMINLLSNAVKFTEKGKVSVESYLDKGQIVVEVQDTGIGISDEDKHKVFERFRQAGDTLTDKPQGTGLGLPICREIIEHHGGIIWMKSEPGVGSTFFFSIPVLGSSEAAVPLPLDKIVRSLRKQIEHTTISSPHKAPTILVVDDDTPIRSLLRQELNDAGYEVKEAANGKAALDMVRVHKPDLIILDVMMPEINGFDVAAVLKNDPDTMDIPIIILSIVQDKERGLRIGVDRYLTKPIDTDQLFKEVGALLEQGVSKKKVLVVDEDQTTIKTLAGVLNARGYNVMETEGKNLVETAIQTQPDIIMLNSIHDGNRQLVKTLKFEKGMENVLFFLYQ